MYDFNLSIMSEPIKVLVQQDEICMESGPLKDTPYVFVSFDWGSGS